MVAIVSKPGDVEGRSASPRVEVFHMDYGVTSTTPAHCLLRLPERLAQIPPFAVEVYCCQVGPIDRDIGWSFQADHAVKCLIFEKELFGRVMTTSSEEAVIL